MLNQGNMRPLLVGGRIVFSPDRCIDTFSFSVGRADAPFLILLLVFTAHCLFTTLPFPSDPLVLVTES